MSLADLTRNSFQSGLSAPKWLGLCKLFISKELQSSENDQVQQTLSNSVLSILRFYPGDPDLQEYLRYAIQEGVLSVAVFVSTLLQAARSPELHHPATLDMLCGIALDAHYASRQMPIGSIVPYDESPIVTLGTVQEALVLLRTAHSLPISHFHNLTLSASNLVILLLTCVSDMSQVSTAQAMVHFADTNDLLQNFRLSDKVRQVLETFMLSLSLLIGDDAKAAREAQMMHSLQVALGKGDVIGPNSSSDTITLGLLMHHIILNRARAFGSGSTEGTVAILVAVFQWSSWTPAVFYTQLFTSALQSLSQHQYISAILWRAFIVGRLPHLLVEFEKAVKNDSQGDGDWRGAMQSAMVTINRRRDITSHCDHVLVAADGETQNPPLFRTLLARLIVVGLVEEPFATSLDSSVAESKTSTLTTEAQHLGSDIETYLDSKINSDISYDDLYTLVDRICRDPSTHFAFASVISQRVDSLAVACDVEGLSNICKVLYMHDKALDFLSLHVKMNSLLAKTLTLIERYDCETIGDPQTAVIYLGEIVLFTQHALAHFNMNVNTFTEGVSPQFLQSTAVVFAPERLNGEDSLAFTAWFKTLFDSSSEGIEDAILRTSKPKTLLKITASLFATAIKARQEGKIDADILNNGISFFIGPLLSWTLVGVVKSLLKEVQRANFKAPVHLEVLQTLLTSSSCPRPVLVLCGSQILTVLTSKNAKDKLSMAGTTVAKIQRIVTDALGPSESAHIAHTLATGLQNLWRDQFQHAVHEALATARSNKTMFIDVNRLVKTTTPTRLMQTLWTELSMSASLGEMENCRRIATFVLTIPTCQNSPPLLPIFLHRVLPSVILSVDALETTQQTPNVELLVILVSSVLTSALHLELALRGSQWENRSVLGEPIIAMAKRLATDLRSMKQSYTATAIVQRLGSAQSFVSNFPMFMSDIGL